MIKQEIKNLIREALDIPPSYEFAVSEPPKNVPFDMASNVAILLSTGSKTGQTGRYTVEEIAKKLEKIEVTSDIQPAPQGFLNFNISNKRLHDELRKINTKKDAYPVMEPLVKERTLIDLVSSNPTGPVHIGHARGAVIGDVLAKIIRHTGGSVDIEYYVNDSGTQIETLVHSIELRSSELAGQKVVFPENHYTGDYVKKIAGEIMSENNGMLPEDKTMIARSAIEKILDNIKNDLSDFGVEFNNWVYESGLHKKDIVGKAVDLLRKNLMIYENEGATWFKSQQAGDEKDRVVVRTDGSYTYFGADIGYHLYKFERGYEKLINVWGADHHGYVPRLVSAIKSMGYRQGADVILYQLVSLLRAGIRVRMSTRAGEYTTLREVMNEIGRDAARFFLSTRTPSAHLEFDLEVAKKRSSENPVYYIQYAHTRCCGILRETEKSGTPQNGVPDLDRLSQKEERAIMRKIVFYPDCLFACVANLTPHHLPSYLLSLAGLFHRFYDEHRVISPDPAVTAARLYLVRAVKTVLGNALGLMGISSPERM